MLTLIGVVCQLKVTVDSYKSAIKLKNAVEVKFHKLYKEYLELKQKAEKSLEETSEAFRCKNNALFRNHLENAEFEYNLLRDKLRSIDNDLNFTPDEMPIYSKILSVFSLFGSICLGFYKWFDSISVNTRLCLEMFTISAIVCVGIVAVYFAYNTRALDEKLRFFKTEAVEIEKSIKRKIDLLKMNEANFFIQN